MQILQWRKKFGRRIGLFSKEATAQVGVTQSWMSTQSLELKPEELGIYPTIYVRFHKMIIVIPSHVVAKNFSVMCLSAGVKTPATQSSQDNSSSIKLSYKHHPGSWVSQMLLLLQLP